ncbi:hypothetical protein ANCCEY_09108 [Ancylostoma ceylanicum]|uniref:7TM GPCR serpentine receptor class x (Srx) domain-containing protein n=1 Tax=Ancylostoma ceylanicum TaxID=53326 RepID=A0A0D6LIH8_9BILA|nr:hypothetical protein ANCCEY_09108 [Ancylostoma ceylanicum]
MSNESLPLFLPNPNREVLTIGIVYSTLAACAIPIYVPVLYVMFTDKDITSNPQYRLMNQINIADFGQISGCTTNSLWLAMFPIMSVLSITRILVIREIISPKYTHTGLKILMVFGWLYTIGVWLWGCITQNFILAGVGWTYDLTKLGAETLAALEWTIRVKVLRVVGGKVGQVSIHNLSVASKQTRQKTNTLSQT